VYSDSFRKSKLRPFGGGLGLVPQCGTQFCERKSCGCWLRSVPVLYGINNGYDCSRTACGRKALLNGYTHGYFFANRGHWSSTYFSAASRTIQAIDTFFRLARSSNVWYRSGGKVMEARGWPALLAFLAFCLPITI